MLKHNNIVKLVFLFSLLFLSISFAQQALLKLSFIGYGKTYQEVFISFQNAGDVDITDITVYIDGNAYKTIEGGSAPDSTFEDVLFLEEGDHLIEARTPEGAYDSLTVTAKKGEVPAPAIEPSTEIEGEMKTEVGPGLLEIVAQNTLLIFAIFLMILLVFIWLQKRRSK